MNAYPILFNRDMVRAVVEGSKTQTRRAAKLNAAGRVARGGRNWHPDDPEAVLACPFGGPGDYIWVRETFACQMCSCPGMEDCYDFVYAAEMPGQAAPTDDGKWTPSIHMPREASRIWLRIMSCRLERLSLITETDAWAEGFPDPPGLNNKRADRARYWFRQLWDSIYSSGGKVGWNASPLVWVVEFKNEEAHE